MEKFDFLFLVKEDVCKMTFDYNKSIEEQHKKLVKAVVNRELVLAYHRSYLPLIERDTNENIDTRISKIQEKLEKRLKKIKEKQTLLEKQHADVDLQDITDEDPEYDCYYRLMTDRLKNTIEKYANLLENVNGCKHDSYLVGDHSFLLQNDCPDPTFLFQNISNEYSCILSDFKKELKKIINSSFKKA